MLTYTKDSHFFVIKALKASPRSLKIKILINFQSSIRALLEIFSSIFTFCEIKVTITQNIRFKDYASGNWLPKTSFHFSINRKNDNHTTIWRHEVIVHFFFLCFVSLAKIIYWSQFYVNIIAGSGVMTIFFNKGLTKKFGNTPVWVLPNTWRLGRVRDTLFGTNVSDKMLLNAAKYQGYSFYPFWVIKGKSTAGWGGQIIPTSHTHPDLG